jgi:hypothetical protein
MAFQVGDAVMVSQLSFTTHPASIKSALGFIHFCEFLEIVYMLSIITFSNSSLPWQAVETQKSYYTFGFNRFWPRLSFIHILIGLELVQL